MPATFSFSRIYQIGRDSCGVIALDSLPASNDRTERSAQIPVSRFAQRRYVNMDLEARRVVRVTGRDWSLSNGGETTIV